MHHDPDSPNLHDELARALDGALDPDTIPAVVHDLIVPTLKRTFAAAPAGMLEALGWTIDAYVMRDDEGPAFIVLPPRPIDEPCTRCTLTYLDLPEPMVATDRGWRHASCPDDDGDLDLDRTIRPTAPEGAHRA